MKAIPATLIAVVIFAAFFYLDRQIDDLRETWPWYFNVIGIIAGLGILYAMKKWLDKTMKENRRPHDLDAHFHGKDGDGAWVTAVECNEAISWLETHRDQGLWYKIVFGFNYDNECTHDVVEWIVKQPDCQNTIAVAVMDLIHMSDYCGVGALNYSEDWTHRILMAISERDQKNPFPSDQLSDPERLDRIGILKRCMIAAAECQAAGKQPLLPVPLDTLSTIPTGPQPASNFLVDEEGISELQPNNSAG